MSKQKDAASRIIKAPADKIFNAFLDREAVASWRPPEGMECKIYEFDPRPGGRYRMSFDYKNNDHNVAGKTSQHSDVFTGRFVELVPNERMVEAVDFESDDPAFAGTMTVTTTFTPKEYGTEVAFVCEDVPAGIKPADHQEGMASTLKNLAAFTE